VHFSDLRFDRPFRAAGRRPLSAGVLLDRGKVVAEFMGKVAQPAPD
jgi:hypothetical protein